MMMPGMMLLIVKPKTSLSLSSFKEKLYKDGMLQQYSWAALS